MCGPFVWGCQGSPHKGPCLANCVPDDACGGSRTSRETTGDWELDGKAHKPQERFPGTKNGLRGKTLVNMAKKNWLSKNIGTKTVHKILHSCAEKKKGKVGRK